MCCEIFRNEVNDYSQKLSLPLTMVIIANRNSICQRFGDCFQNYSFKTIYSNKKVKTSIVTWNYQNKSSKNVH